MGSRWSKHNIANGLKGFLGATFLGGLDEAVYNIDNKVDELNATKATKTYVTPEEYGAIGDGITDDTNAMQNAINSNRPVFMTGHYKISSIYLDGDKTVYSTGTIDGDVILKRIRNIFHFNIINGSILVISENYMTYSNTIRGNLLRNLQGIGLELKATAELNGVQYNDISILIIRAEECIVFNSLGGWVNNNYIHHTNPSYGTGIVSRIAQARTKYDKNTFSYIGFETLNKYMDLKTVNRWSFDNIRMLSHENNDGADCTINDGSVIFGYSVGGNPYEIFKGTNYSTEIDRPLSASGTIDASRIIITNNTIVQASWGDFAQIEINTSGETYIDTFAGNFHIPIIVNGDSTSYKRINFNLKKLSSAVKILNLYFPYATQGTIEVAVNNKLLTTLGVGTVGNIIIYNT